MKQNSTEQRVLECACEMFASNGYSNTTVASICHSAEANIAAVNYYFKNKEELYKSAWRYALEISDKVYPADNKESDLKERLNSFLRNRLESIFDPGPAGWFPRIINREMANPSPIASELFDKFLAPRQKKLEQMIFEMLGKTATDVHIRTCALNVLSSYAFINTAEKPRQHLFGTDQPSKQQVEALIIQIQDFVSAAIEGTKKSITRRDSQ